MIVDGNVSSAPAACAPKIAELKRRYDALRKEHEELIDAVRQAAREERKAQEAAAAGAAGAAATAATGGAGGRQDHPDRRRPGPVRRVDLQLDGVPWCVPHLRWGRHVQPAGHVHRG